MAYKPHNPAEQAAQDAYTQNRGLIEEWARAHPKVKDPREAGYQAITGQVWPAGRGVNSKGIITGDRTFKSVLGRYVALPAAIGATAAFAPGALPAIGHALMSGVGAAGHAVGGALGIGGGGSAALGTAPAISSATGAANAAALGTGLGTASGTGLIASSAIPTSLAMHAAPAALTAGGNLAAAGAGGGGLISGLTNRLGGDLAQRMIGGAGAGISGASQAAATNRGVGLDAALAEQEARQRQQEAYQNQLIARSQEDRDSLTDAFTKSVQAQRVLNNSGYQPAQIPQLPGASPSAIPSFGTGMKAPTEGMRGDAQSLYDEAMKRLKGGSQLPPLATPTPYTNDPNLLKPGAGEKIGSWLGPALGVASGLRRIL